MKERKILQIKQGNNAEIHTHVHSLRLANERKCMYWGLGHSTIVGSGYINYMLCS